VAWTSSTLQAACVTSALLCAVLAGCEQDDDVVASLKALSDGGGGVAGSVVPAAPTPDAGAPDCETSQIYVLLSSIVRNQCRVPSSPTTLAVLGAFFLQNPPVGAPGEARPVSVCDLFGGRVAWLYEQMPGSGDYFVCPANCDVAAQYVAAEDQRLLACQGFGGG